MNPKYKLDDVVVFSGGMGVVTQISQRYKTTYDQVNAKYIKSTPTIYYTINGHYNSNGHIQQGIPQQDIEEFDIMGKVKVEKA